MKAVPQIINNECGDGDCGAEGGRGAGGHGLVQFGGQGEGASGRHKVGFSCVCLWSVFCGGGAPNGSLGPLAKTPVGLTWQPHEAAWQEESCI